jgi:hypothetical protein
VQGHAEEGGIADAGDLADVLRGWCEWLRHHQSSFV